MNKVIYDVNSVRATLVGEWKSLYSPRYGTDFDDYQRSKQYFGYKYATWTTAKGDIALLIEDSKQHEVAITLISKNQLKEFPSDYQDAVKHAVGLCGIIIP